jgi:hypothetical protein
LGKSRGGCKPRQDHQYRWNSSHSLHFRSISNLEDGVTEEFVFKKTVPPPLKMVHMKIAKLYCWLKLIELSLPVVPPCAVAANALAERSSWIEVSASAF